jgi:hypothetical protein
MRLFPITFWATNTAPSAGFDYFRRGEPQLAIVGSGAGGFNYFRRGESLRGLR